jgi:hypothetical protein
MKPSSFPSRPVYCIRLFDSSAPSLPSHFPLHFMPDLAWRRQSTNEALSRAFLSNNPDNRAFTSSCSTPSPHSSLGTLFPRRRLAIDTHPKSSPEPIPVVTFLQSNPQCGVDFQTGFSFIGRDWEFVAMVQLRFMRSEFLSERRPDCPARWRVVVTTFGNCCSPIQ